MKKFAALATLSTLLLLAQCSSPDAPTPAPAPGGSPVIKATAVTFSRDVAPILKDKCQACHRPGAIAPFSLLTYQDAKPHLKQIREDVVSGDMPPWKAEAGCGDFQDPKTLTPTQVKTITDWVDAGGPEGNPADMPAPAVFPDEWAAGTPDTIIAPRAPYAVTATGDDDYHCFVLPFQADQDRYVTGFEVRPDRASVVHHAIVYIDYTGESTTLDPTGNGYTCFGGPGVKQAAILGGWAPGMNPLVLPKGIGNLIPKGARLVMQVHYHKDGKLEQDQTRIGLRFAKEPVEHPLHILGGSNENFVIPAGEKHHEVTAELTLPIDAKVLSILPHMHLLGREMKITAQLPDGSNRCMIHIPDWDFHWQYFYSYKDFVSLPKGTRLIATAYYDNTEQNPDQPNHPVKDVRFGEGTTDEMCVFFIGYIADGTSL